MNSDAEIQFATEIIQVLNKYIQNKTLDIMEERFNVLRNELEYLSSEILEAQREIKLETPVSLNHELSNNTAMCIMTELGDYEIEDIPEEGIEVCLKIIP